MLIRVRVLGDRLSRIFGFFAIEAFWVCKGSGFRPRVFLKGLHGHYTGLGLKGFRTAT